MKIVIGVVESLAITAVVFSELEKQLLQLMGTEKPLGNKIIAEGLLPGTLMKEQGADLDRAEQAQLLGPFAEFSVAWAGFYDVPDSGLVEPAPALSNLAQQGALLALPGDGANQGVEWDQTEIIKELSELQRPLRQRACTLGRPMGRILPPALLIAGGCRRWGLMNGSTPPPLLKEGLHRLMSLVEILEQLYLTSPDCRCRDSETIGMHILGLFVIGRTDPSGLEIVQEFPVELKVRPKYGPAGTKNLGFR